MNEANLLPGQVDFSREVLPRLNKPTLVLQVERVRDNLSQMAEKAAKQGVRLRPHVKTPQSAEVVSWCRDFGIEAITVSSLVMAAYFADAGWDDVTVAFPFNPREIHLARGLARKIKLGLMVDSLETARFLVENLGEQAGIWLKVDAGYGRAGVSWDKPASAANIAELIVQAQNLRLIGLLTHAGHTHLASGPGEIMQIHRQSVERMNKMRKELESRGLGPLEVSIGDTPSCNLAQEFDLVDEIRPGTFILNDTRIERLGACRQDEIACALACPVVSVYPGRGDILIYGGAIHLSKDHDPAPDGGACYGRVALPDAGGWGPFQAGAWVRALSQEHGIIKAGQALLDRIKVGDMLMVLPVHICLVVNLMDSFVTTEGRRIAADCP